MNVQNNVYKYSALCANVVMINLTVFDETENNGTVESKFLV